MIVVPTEEPPAGEVRTYVVADRTQVNAAGVVHTEGQTVDLADGPETTALLAAGTITPAPAKPARVRKR